uniref:Uncharacterized protein n=1 Tax=Oryza rufipogon TaxID=4529 RepID=A0A0E0Q3J8_ORYRU
MAWLELCQAESESQSSPSREYQIERPASTRGPPAGGCVMQSFGFGYALGLLTTTATRRRRRRAAATARVASALS